MKKLQLLRVDNDLVQKTNLQIGSNIIGLSVGSERSNGQNRHAATINLSSENEMTITPVLSCYMKSTEASRWQLLKLGVTVPIKPGDICSLISDQCWFKVVSEPSMMEIIEENIGKRKANENISCDIPDKKLCLESGEGDNLRCINTPNDILAYNNNICTTKTEEPIKTEVNLSNNAESVGSNIQESDIFSSNDVNKNSTNVTEQNDTSLIAESMESHASVEIHTSNVSVNTPSDTPRREKCIYGEKCYRRNKQHKTKYSHPMDSDYNMIDNRKECPYGIQCYRTNPQHKKEYKHIKVSNNRNRNRASKKATLVSSNNLSDLEDSFSEDSAEESIDESDYIPSSSDAENWYDNEYNESEIEWEDDTTDD